MAQAESFFQQLRSFGHCHELPQIHYALGSGSRRGLCHCDGADAGTFQRSRSTIAAWRAGASATAHDLTGAGSIRTAAIR
jgi:hypothetical protein